MMRLHLERKVTCNPRGDGLCRLWSHSSHPVDECIASTLKPIRGGFLIILLTTLAATRSTGIARFASNLNSASRCASLGGACDHTNAAPEDPDRHRLSNPRHLAIAVTLAHQQSDHRWTAPSSPWVSDKLKAVRGGESCRREIPRQGRTPWPETALSRRM